RAACPLSSRAGNVGPARPAARAAPRIRARAAHSAGVERSASRGGRLPLSRPAAPAQGRAPSGRVGRVVDQPTGAHLLPYAHGQKTPSHRSFALRADVERSVAGARPARRMTGLRDLFRRRAELVDLKAEIRAHLDEKIASLVAAGMPHAEAEQAARRAFGSVATIEDSARDVWRMPRADDLVADVGFAFRFVRRSPALAVVAISSLALGIGVNLAVFTVINALLLRPLPVAHPGALVVFSRQDADTGRMNSLTFHEYAALGARTSSFVGLLAHAGGDGALQVGATPVPNGGERIRFARVSSNFFDVLGVGMAVGRGFLPVDDSAADPERS